MTLPPRHASSLGYIQTSVVNKQQYNNTQTGAHERRSQNPMVCRKTLEHISWRVRHFFLESPAFLPGESGISSWRVRHFFLESPVSFPGESGIPSWRVRYLFLESPVSFPGESGIFSWRVRYLFLESAGQSREHLWKCRSFRS